MQLSVYVFMISYYESNFIEKLLWESGFQIFAEIEMMWNENCPPFWNVCVCVGGGVYGVCVYVGVGVWVCGVCGWVCVGVVCVWGCFCGCVCVCVCIFAWIFIV